MLWCSKTPVQSWTHLHVHGSNMALVFLELSASKCWLPNMPHTKRNGCILKQHSARMAQAKHTQKMAANRLIMRLLLQQSASSLMIHWQPFQFHLHGFTFCERIWFMTGLHDSGTCNAVSPDNREHWLVPTVRHLRAVSRCRWCLLAMGSCVLGTQPIPHTSICHTATHACDRFREATFHFCIIPPIPMVEGSTILQRG